MSTEEIKVSVVSYLNSKPFVFGLKKSNIYNQVQLSLDNPASCAQKLIDGDAEIGLVPVAAIPMIPNGKIISDFCISATGKVESVLMVSHVPLKEIKTIMLDSESRTSVQLAKILARDYWKINPVWYNEPADGIDKVESGVLIGDRALKLKGKFEYIYDLSEEWNKMTGLPFVFACWVANRDLPKEFTRLFNEALDYGVTHIKELVTAENLSEENREYLINSIQYTLNGSKREALELFLKMSNEIR